MSEGLLDKKVYKITEVSEILGVPQSTLRFWEKEFPEYAPKRSPGGVRHYTPADIKRFRIIHYLLRVQGLRIEAAREQMRINPDNISKRLEMIDKLTAVRDDLQLMLDTLVKRK